MRITKNCKLILTQ
ncbi:MAG: hypothetical protein B7Z49_02375 [Hydrogenophilales bacterium 12-63-5]|nr:MAG: hypothetical protein B7Z49_02375 [Hydrogenophilales bacterium 12-63-5]